ncbi:MAG: hypothetical protein OEX12_13370 [Gammaproteobacteria bacterium]|nr:hypothetical protein [Gammaproteobacteria bacterium]
MTEVVLETEIEIYEIIETELVETSVGGLDVLEIVDVDVLVIVDPDVEVVEAIAEGFTGPQGPKGPQGDIGPIGPNGEVAAHQWGNGIDQPPTAIQWQREDGSWGDWIDLKGSQGDVGDTGPKGDTGGPPEHRWGDGIVHSVTSIQWKNPDGTWGPWIELEGPQGIQGIIGAKGDQGDMPEHQWGDGVAQSRTAIRWRNPDGISWGSWVDIGENPLNNTITIVKHDNSYPAATYIRHIGTIVNPRTEFIGVMNAAVVKHAYLSGIHSGYNWEVRLRIAGNDFGQSTFKLMGHPQHCPGFYLVPNGAYDTHIYIKHATVDFDVLVHPDSYGEWAITEPDMDPGFGVTPLVYTPDGAALLHEHSDLKRLDWVVNHTGYGDTIPIPTDVLPVGKFYNRGVGASGPFVDHAYIHGYHEDAYFDAHVQFTGSGAEGPLISMKGSLQNCPKFYIKYEGTLNVLLFIEPSKSDIELYAPTDSYPGWSTFFSTPQPIENVTLVPYTSDGVTLDTAQTISGVKTFTGVVKLDNGGVDGGRLFFAKDPDGGTQTQDPYLDVINDKLRVVHHPGASTRISYIDLNAPAGKFWTSGNLVFGTGANDMAAGNHAHDFSSLTNKELGTGDYSTDGDVVSGRGSGGVALTINDGYGNANVTFNHQDGVPEQTGNAARIVVNTDATTGASMDFQLKSGVVGETATGLTSLLKITESVLTFLGNAVWHAGNLAFGTSNSNMARGDHTHTAAQASAARAYTSANGYNGITLNDGGTSTWFRTTVNGLLPYASGGASALGTATWPFSAIYGNNIYDGGVLLESKYAALGHAHTFASITSKPTTVAGYGITDGVTVDTAQTISGAKIFSDAISVIKLDPLGTALNDIQALASIGGNTANLAGLDVKNIRFAAGSDWTTSKTRMQRRVDITKGPYLDFYDDKLNIGVYWSSAADSEYRTIDVMSITANGIESSGSVKASTALELGPSSEASVAYNSTSKSIDFRFL